jgi:hypothetical protein
MARPLDTALMTLLARLRARRSGRASLMLLGWLLLAQTGLVVHRIDHNAADNNTLCAACVAADHFADVGAAPVVATVPQPPASVLATIAESAGTPPLVHYHSRAPPKRSLA